MLIQYEMDATRRTARRSLVEDGHVSRCRVTTGSRRCNVKDSISPSTPTRSNPKHRNDPQRAQRSSEINASANWVRARSFNAAFISKVVNFMISPLECTSYFRAVCYAQVVLRNYSDRIYFLHLQRHLSPGEWGCQSPTPHANFAFLPRGTQIISPFLGASTFCRRQLFRMWAAKSKSRFSWAPSTKQKLDAENDSGQCTSSQNYNGCAIPWSVSSVPWHFQNISSVQGELSQHTYTTLVVLYSHTKIKICQNIAALCAEMYSHGRNLWYSPARCVQFQWPTHTTRHDHDHHQDMYQLDSW